MFQITPIHFALLFSLVSSLFRAGQALSMQQSCQSTASHPWTPGKGKYIPPRLFPHSMTKCCPFSPLGCDPLLYTLSPLWPLALVSVPRLQSPQSVFDPLSLFLPHTSLTIQNEVQDERCGDERAEERAQSPSKGETQQKSQIAAIDAGMNRKHNLFPVRSHFSANSF